MRFMMLVIPPADLAAKADWAPDPKAMAAMGQYNESLQKAGVLLDLNGLQPPSKAVRVTFSGGKPKVTDGPFAEAKEVIGGYWIIQVKSKEEAVAWACRCPAPYNETIAIRQVYEFADFPADVQAIAEQFPEMQRRRAAQQRGT